jgi:hypothetical protein
MRPELTNWERKWGLHSPTLLVVSSGSAEENKLVGLHSTVLLDHGFGTASSYGANGTPSAIVVDRSGRLASELAVGSDAIFELIRAWEHSQAEAS